MNNNRFLKKNNSFYFFYQIIIMEHKYMKNPYIIKFLEQYDKSEWDGIIEDLIMNSINEIKKIEKGEEKLKRKEMPPKIFNQNSDFISFNFNNSDPYECATNLLKQNAKLKSYSGSNKKKRKKKKNKKQRKNV